MKLTLTLADGTIFTGTSFGAEHSVAGEVVFNTGMVGYPESLTDPSYAGQILVCTYPLIGNYGVPDDSLDEWKLLKHFESARIQVAGLIVAEYVDTYSHWAAKRSLGEWLREHGIPAVTDIDTRALTQHLREKGTSLGKLVLNGNGKKSGDIAWSDPNARNIVAEVSTAKVITYGEERTLLGKKRKKRVLLIDCGVKYNIIRSFLKRGVEVVRVPWNHPIMDTDIAYDGIFISNGPGDPKQCGEAVTHLRKALTGKKPILGICMGNLLLGLAAGGDTYKLPYGHRSQNQPCVVADTERCYITSQNHGFAVDLEKMPRGWEPWFTNANDGSHEGMRHKTKPFMSVQFHPEATPGPTDTAWIFDEFIKLL